MSELIWDKPMRNLASDERGGIVGSVHRNVVLPLRRQWKWRHFPSKKFGEVADKDAARQEVLNAHRLHLIR